jgi:S1-C subfamily serine protease
LTNSTRDNIKYFAIALIAVSIMCESHGGASQLAKRETGISPETRALVSQATAATGLVLVRNSSDPGQAPRPRGSAVVVRRDGIVVTNNHVITNDRTGRLYDEIVLSLASSDGNLTASRYRLKPLVISKEYDLALLQIESAAAGNQVKSSFVFPAIEIGDSRKIKLLDDLFIIGFPEKGGSTVTVNRGVIEGRDILGNWIKTDARVIHGNSGGAAVNSEGKLIGIPTKVVADEQPIDKDGDGFPDDYRRFGAVGFLRPAHLVSEMLARLDHQSSERQLSISPTGESASSKAVNVHGIVKSAGSGKPIAGALVGLLPPGETSVTESTLLTWGSTNGEGQFTLNKPVPPGRYTIRVKALGEQPYTSEIEIVRDSPALIVEMNSLPDR